jgi:hypothetical protein
LRLTLGTSAAEARWRSSEQGIAANATPRAIRGENKKYPRESMFKAQRYGTSTALHDRVLGIANELSHSRTILDPARDRLIETSKSLVSAWMKAAEVLDAQGEIILAGYAMKSETNKQFAFNLESRAKLRRDPNERALRLRQVSQLTGLGRSIIYQMQPDPQSDARRSTEICRVRTGSGCARRDP